MSVHYHQIDDDKGDLVELVAFCSDSCHQQWCRDNAVTYGGWNGCHESDQEEECASCHGPLHFAPMTTAEHDQIMHGPECNDPTLHEHYPEDADPERYEHTCPGSQ